MNKAKLKSYAPQARRDFIAAVTARANLLGIASKAGQLELAASQPQGDATVIAGQAWPIKVHNQRQQLIVRIQKDGFAQTMEAIAYTWFNRFAALRYMELHDYLGHGHRVLSSLDGSVPDILTHATDVVHGGDNGLPGLKSAVVAEMKLAGNRDGELYRLLLVAQCNALSSVMPFLFERIDDETELLLPDNLLRSDSVIAKLVNSIEEDDWKEVEVIGWLYQFYISEKKQEVIGQVVQSADIPAATQLFTPNWIVQYLVQNSVGRLWLMANPASTLQAQWLYYIQPADQTPEVEAQLDELIQTRVCEDGDSLNPESITLLDPACGSGHILLEAYEVFKAIYLERGYQPRAIPRLILEKNLYGLDIDDRAAQMAGFVLLMKARGDDRRLLQEPIRLNVLSLQESKGLDAVELTRALQTVTDEKIPQRAVNAISSGVEKYDHLPVAHLQFSAEESNVAYIADDLALRSIVWLIDTFSHAKTFGSLIQISPALNAQLATMAERLQMALQNGDLYAKAAARDLLPLVEQAQVLGMQVDASVANPPYMGNRGYNEQLKTFLNENYFNARENIFAAFVERNLFSLKASGIASLVTMHNWMFLNRFQEFRGGIIRERTIESLIHHGAGAFEEISGEVVQTASFSLRKTRILNYSAAYITALALEGGNKSDCHRDKNNCHIGDMQTTFQKIPGEPIAYWLTPNFSNIFSIRQMGDICEPREGLTTGNNAKHVRQWYEVNLSRISFGVESREQGRMSGGKWFPYNKGGAYRKWYGNIDSVVNWERDGEELQNTLHPSGKRIWAHNFNLEYIFGDAVTWTDITSAGLAARYMPKGCIFDASGLSAFYQDEASLWFGLAAANSNVAEASAPVLNPTLHFKAGDFKRLPLPLNNLNGPALLAKKAMLISKVDWDSFETSWDFERPEILESSAPLLQDSWVAMVEKMQLRHSNLQDIEVENNRLFIHAYGLEDELSPDVPDSRITLSRPDREKDCQRILSYAIGCMMGRYSLDAPGLIYAHGGNIDFDASRYASFPADVDGIVPLTDELWFEDEAASRVREFLLAVWGTETLAQNMAWLAESLGIKAGETPDEAIRRYLADKFYKDHLQTYKKRPIYWLFSSGKQGAFQALVYLHRYHEGTLGRLRAEYVVPLTGKIQSRIDMLEKDAAAASSAASRNKLAKEVAKLKKKHVELLAYDEQLRHHADMRITLDLDDGVKVNYGKFGDLLAEVKAITGSASDD